MLPLPAGLFRFNDPCAIERLSAGAVAAAETELAEEEEEAKAAIWREKKQKERGRSFARSNYNM